MRVVVYGPAKRVGLLESNVLYDAENLVRAFLDSAEPSNKKGVPADLRGFIASGDEALSLVQRALEWTGKTKLALRPDDVRLHAPWPGLRIAGAGANFADHFASGMTARGHAMTTAEAYKIVRADEPLGYWKVPSEAVGADGDIQYPTRCNRLDFEGEVAIIIGKQGKDIPLDKAMSYVWGVTLLNDWSIRTPPNARLFPFSLNLDKNFDGGTSIGPWIVVGNVDPTQLNIRVRVNGKLRQDFNTRDMVYSFAEYIHFLSRDFTLLPGDMIASGTGSGTAADTSRPGPDGILLPELFLSIGDVVEVEVAQIGVLRNRIVPKQG